MLKIALLSPRQTNTYKSLVIHVLNWHRNCCHPAENFTTKLSFLYTYTKNTLTQSKFFLDSITIKEKIIFIYFVYIQQKIFFSWVKSFTYSVSVSQIVLLTLVLTLKVLSQYLFIYLILWPRNLKNGYFIILKF